MYTFRKGKLKKELALRAANSIPVEYAEKNSIARGVWACSPSTYKIISLACSLLSNGKMKDGYWVEFSMSGLIKTLGIKDGTATRALYDKSIKDAFGSTIEYEVTGKDGGKGWVRHHWFTDMMYSYDWGVCQFKFNETLAGYILSNDPFFKKNLEEISQFKSSYAISYYTIAKSWAGMSGKKGNRAGEWFFEYSVDGLRKVLAVKKDEYLDVRNFHRRCIDLPLKEVNEKNVGFTIQVEKIKSGGKIVVYRFHCRENSAGRTVSRDDVLLSDYTLIQRNRKLYDELLADEPEPEPAYPGQELSGEWREEIKKARALEKLRKFVS
jgi:plasmid replication initiation protein